VQVPTVAQDFPIDVRELAVTHLAHFVGAFANQHVLSEMKRAGFGDLRESHGFLVQHLLRGPHSVGELSRLMGVSQQAVSKTVAELTRSGYLETQAGDDARVRLLRLSERGHASVLASRRIREKLERRLSDKLGAKKLAALRASLCDALQALGGTAAVQGRRVPLSSGGSKG
jgi:DNA-binding MarR family transcriptional regulator